VVAKGLGGALLVGGSVRTSNKKSELVSGFQSDADVPGVQLNDHLVAIIGTPILDGQANQPERSGSVTNSPLLTSLRRQFPLVVLVAVPGRDGACSQRPGQSNSHPCRLGK